MAQMGSTEFSNVTVKQADTITVDYTTVLPNPNAQIQVYPGLSVTYSNMSGAIISQPITQQAGTATLKLPAGTQENFTNGFYTIIFDVGLDSSSLGALVHLNNGQPFGYQSTQIFLLGQQSGQLNVMYQVPQGNTPQTNHDWIVLFEGSEVQSGDASGRLQYYWIPTNSVSNPVQCSINPPNLTVGQQYILEYNPGHQYPGVSAFYAFEYDA